MHDLSKPSRPTKPSMQLKVLPLLSVERGGNNFENAIGVMVDSNRGQILGKGVVSS